VTTMQQGETKRKSGIDKKLGKAGGVREGRPSGVKLRSKTEWEREKENGARGTKSKVPEKNLRKYTVPPSQIKKNLAVAARKGNLGKRRQPQGEGDVKRQKKRSSFPECLVINRVRQRTHGR